jgi:hypothetical protein
MVICGGGEEHPIAAASKSADTIPARTVNDAIDRLVVPCFVIEELLHPSIRHTDAF